MQQNVALLYPQTECAVLSVLWSSQQATSEPELKSFLGVLLEREILSLK